MYIPCWFFSHLNVLYDYINIGYIYIFYCDFFTYKSSISSTEVLHMVAKQSCILVFYYYVKNYHKLRGLKPRVLDNSLRFCRSLVQVEWIGFFAYGLSRPKLWCRPGWALIWEEFASNLIQLFGRIQFLAAIGLRSCPCSLGGCQSRASLSQLLKATRIPSHLAPSILKQQQQPKSFLSFKSLWLFPFHSKPEKSVFNSLCN